MLVYSQGAGVGEYTQGSEEVIVREDEGAKGAPRECEEGSALQAAKARRFATSLSWLSPPQRHVAGHDVDHDEALRCPGAPLC